MNRISSKTYIVVNPSLLKHPRGLLDYGYENGLFPSSVHDVTSLNPGSLSGTRLGVEGGGDGSFKCPWQRQLTVLPEQFLSPVFPAAQQTRHSSLASRRTLPGF